MKTPKGGNSLGYIIDNAHHIPERRRCGIIPYCYGYENISSLQDFWGIMQRIDRGSPYPNLFHPFRVFVELTLIYRYFLYVLTPRRG